MKEINKFLKTKSNAMGMLITATINIVIGCLILINPDFFIHSIAAIFIIYFALQILVNLLSIVFSITKGLKALIGNIIKASFSVIVFGYLITHIQKVLGILPFIMCVWAFVVCISSMVSFLQYRHEKSTAPIRYFISSVLNLAFGASFVTNVTRAIPTSFTVVALYMILLGLTNLTDAISGIMNKNQKAKLKSKIRFAPPPYLTALIPVKVLNVINDYLASDETHTVDLSISKDDSVPNLEVFIHVSPNGLGRMGHVDIAIENRVVSFGGYDMQSMKLGGGIGIGVVFENFEKEKYIKFCQKESDKTLFGFGLVMKKEELDIIISKLEDIKKRGYIWQSAVQIAQQSNQPIDKIDDYASMLYLATGATFYKFRSGAFKYYWVLGTNCVKLADTLLSSCGLDSVAAGVITPGTYYNYLNNEFLREGSRVVKRTIYHSSQKDFDNINNLKFK